MALPAGTVTLLFSDIEGSTRLLERLGERYSDVLDEHRRIVRGAIAEHGGHEIRTEGDAFFVAFSRAGDAVRAAVAAQRRELLAEARALYARTEDGPGLAGIAQNLGCVELDHGDPERACALLARSAAMWDEQHTPWIASWVLVVFVEAVLAIGDLDTANATVADMRGAFERLGEADGLTRVAELEATTARR